MDLFPQENALGQPDAKDANWASFAVANIPEVTIDESWKILGGGLEGTAYVHEDSQTVIKLYKQNFTEDHFSFFIKLLSTIQTEIEARGLGDSCHMPTLSIVRTNLGLGLSMPFYHGTAVGHFLTPLDSGAEGHSSDAYKIACTINKKVTALIECVSETNQKEIGVSVVDLGDVSISGEIGFISNMIVTSPSDITVQSANDIQLVYFDPVPMASVASFVERTRIKPLVTDTIERLKDERFRALFHIILERDCALPWRMIVESVENLKAAPQEDVDRAVLTHLASFLMRDCKYSFEGPLIPRKDAQHNPKGIPSLFQNKIRNNSWVQSWGAQVKASATILLGNLESIELKFNCRCPYNGMLNEKHMLRTGFEVAPALAPYIAQAIMGNRKIHFSFQHKKQVRPANTNSYQWNVLDQR